jgi:hypothetical protein
MLGGANHSDQVFPVMDMRVLKTGVLKTTCLEQTRFDCSSIQVGQFDSQKRRGEE